MFCLLNRHRLLAVMTAIFFLAGCGGGGSSSDSNEDGAGDPGSGSTSYSEGVFLDSAVSGLQFRLDGEVLTTDESGTFRYEEGVAVEFFIGGISLGSTTGQAVITPLDLVDDAADETDPTVVNIIRFLQSIDDDGDPENGITITTTVRELAQDRTVDFDQDTSSFEADTQALVNELTAATTDGARNLVGIEFALGHFRGTLDEINGGDNPTPAPDGDVVSSDEIVDFFTVPARVSGVTKPACSMPLTSASVCQPLATTLATS